MSASIIRNHIDDVCKYGGSRMGYLTNEDIQVVQDFMKQEGIEGMEIILHSDFQHYLVPTKK